ncbi:MAG: hypothetical protein M5U19_16080 [Microthrixaceae bacterium]|nr:hypothetical protein [Microthrixaceae bacterium]
MHCTPEQPSACTRASIQLYSKRPSSTGATHVSLVHTALLRIDPRPWRRILLGGSAAPPELPPNCVTTYGMTETFGGVVYDGLALNGVQVRIAGTRGDEFGVEGPVELLSPPPCGATEGTATNPIVTHSMTKAGSAPVIWDPSATPTGDCRSRGGPTR